MKQRRAERGVYLGMKLTRDERAELARRAAADDRPLSVWVRRAALDVARGKVRIVDQEEAPRPAA